MEGWQWAIVLKPLGLLGFLLLVRYIAIALSKVLPDSVLFDKTFKDRRPVMAWAIVIGFYVVFFSAVNIYLSH